MNWYKKAQIKTNYTTWLHEQIMKLTNNYSKPLPLPFDNQMAEENFKILENWVKETTPDLSTMGLLEAWNLAYRDSINRRHIKEDPYDPDQIRRNMNRFFADSQNINPKADNFAVDQRKKTKSIPPTIKRRINNAIHDLGNHHNEIPVTEIFEICEQNGVVPLQEDGTYWSGMLLGGAECGSEKARNQYANLELAVLIEGEYVPSNNALSINWCKMGSGRYEVVCYVG